MEDKLYLTFINCQKVLYIEKAKQSSSPHKRSQKIDDTDTILSIITASRTKDAAKKTHTSHTIKQTANAKDAREFFLSSQKSLEQSLEIVKNFIVYLLHLLKT